MERLQRRRRTRSHLISRRAFGELSAPRARLKMSELLEIPRLE
jgi:hypothetical protein